MRAWRAADDTVWGLDIQLPTASKALVIFHHPDGRSARRDRYAWLQWAGPEAADVTATVPGPRMLNTLSDAQAAALFARSMPLDNSDGPAPAPA